MPQLTNNRDGDRIVGGLMVIAFMLGILIGVFVLGVLIVQLFF